MAIPQSLKPIPKADKPLILRNEKARQLIRKHLKAGTGEYEYGPDLGDFLYNTKKGWYLLRKNFDNTYEKGKVCL